MGSAEGPPYLGRFRAIGKYCQRAKPMAADMLLRHGKAKEKLPRGMSLFEAHTSQRDAACVEESIPGGDHSPELAHREPPGLFFLRW
jgi:hypothetical protein